MTQINYGTNAAKRATWSQAPNPRATLAELVEANPDVSEDDIWHEMLERFWRDEDLVKEALRYWFDNNYRSLTGRRGLPSVRPSSPVRDVTPEVKAKSRAKAKKTAAKVEKMVEDAISLMVAEGLQMMMPDNRVIADWTCGEAKRYGGVFAHLAKLGKPDDRIGDVATDDDVKAALK